MENHQLDIGFKTQKRLRAHSKRLFSNSEFDW